MCPAPVVCFSCVEFVHHGSCLVDRSCLATVCHRFWNSLQYSRCAACIRSSRPCSRTVSPLWGRSTEATALEEKLKIPDFSLCRCEISSSSSAEHHFNSQYCYLVDHHSVTTLFKTCPRTPLTLSGLSPPPTLAITIATLAANTACSLT